jgi:hypothetical protein
MTHKKSVWKNGIMEDWNIGFRKNISAFKHDSIIPEFDLI